MLLIEFENKLVSSTSRLNNALDCLCRKRRKGLTKTRTPQSHQTQMITIHVSIPSMLFSLYLCQIDRVQKRREITYYNLTNIAKCPFRQSTASRSKRSRCRNVYSVTGRLWNGPRMQNYPQDELVSKLCCWTKKDESLNLLQYSMNRTTQEKTSASERNNFQLFS